MRAFLIRSVRTASVADLDEPRTSPEDVLVRVAYCGVCGTDLHIFNGEFPVKFPLVPGHEFSGVVEKVGKSVKGLKVGDHVAVDPNISCGSCYYCRKGLRNFCEKWQAIGVTRHGAYAELVSSPATNVYRVPKKAPLERFAFVEPISCILHGMDRASPKRGEKVLVTGLGPIGLLFGQLLKKKGVKLIGADPVRDRLEMAERIGFDSVLDPTEESIDEIVMSSTKGRGVDFVVEASGSTQAAEDAIRLVDKGGKILIFGVAPENASLAVRPFVIYRNEISLIGSFTNPMTFRRAIDVLASGRISVDGLVSKVVSLENVAPAFEEIRQRKGVKYLVKPE